MPAPPPRLGRYEIVREIGRGAMGVVYLARDPLIGRQVALKTFRLAYATDDDELSRLRSRFLREAQSAGILSQHPGIVTIHDVAPGGDGTPAFIAMEYVEGTDLKELIKRQGRLDPAAVADIVRGIASALDYAHIKGVVHRDVKPANVILTTDGGIRITDFGIARLDAFEASNLTLDGQMLGTPNYMSPEQVQGHEVDHRADIFSLGVICYELLTGKKPFSGENLTAVTHRIVHGDYPPPSSVLETLPARVDAVIGRCLEKAPVKRWPRAGDLAAALDEALAEGPVERRVPAAPAGVAGARRHPPAGPAAAGAAPAAADRAAPSAAVPRPVPAAAAAAAAVPLATPRAAGPAAAGPAATPGAAGAAAVPAAPAAGPGWARRFTGPLGARLAADARAAGPRRLAVVAAAALIAGLALSAALMLVPRRLAPPAPETVVDLAPRAQFVSLMREGRAHLAAGDPAAAAVAFRRAERLAPDPARVRALREQAETAAAAGGGAAPLDLTLEGETLAEALGAGGPEDEEMPLDLYPAAAADDAAGRPEAAERTAPSATARPDLGRSRLFEPPPGEAAPARPPAAPRTAPSATTPGAPAATGDSSLVVDLATEVSPGSVVVAAAGRRIISRNFEFFEKEGRFSRRRPSGGTLTLGPATLPAGDIELQVWVSVGDRPAKVSQLTGRFPRGGERRLVVRITSADDVNLRLE